MPEQCIIFAQIYTCKERLCREHKLPRQIDKEIRYIYIYSYIFLGQAYLEIEKHASLGIKISGACCKLPDPTDTIDFESFVREKQTRSVIIMNDSNAPWRLKIEVKGDYFSSDQLLQVPPLQLAPCVVTYAPVSMNTDETLDTVRR